MNCEVLRGYILASFLASWQEIYNFIIADTVENRVREVLDDMMHGQKQGRSGMYQDVALLTQKHQLHDVVSKEMIARQDRYLVTGFGGEPTFTLKRNAINNGNL
jgi:hypothetical protein